MTLGPRIHSSPRSPGPTSALASSFMILAEQLGSSSPMEDAPLVEEVSVNGIDPSVEGSRDASGGPVIIAQAVNLVSLLAVRAVVVYLGVPRMEYVCILCHAISLSHGQSSSLVNRVNVPEPFSLNLIDDISGYRGSPATNLHYATQIPVTLSDP